MKSLGARNWFAAGRSVVTSCSNTAPVTSSTTRTQADEASARRRSSASARRPRDGGARAHIDERRRAARVVGDELPAGMGAALKADADAADDSAQRQRGGERGRRWLRPSPRSSGSITLDRDRHRRGERSSSPRRRHPGWPADSTDMISLSAWLSRRAADGCAAGRRSEARHHSDQPGALDTGSLRWTAALLTRRGSRW